MVIPIETSVKLHRQVELHGRRYRLCIVNPITKQVAQLPPCPEILYEELTCYSTSYTYRCGFVLSSSSSYKVVVITSALHPQPGDKFRASIYSSETGEWSVCFRFYFSVKLDDWYHTPIGCNGVVYWSFGILSYARIVGFDPTTIECCSITLPVEFDTSLNRNDHFSMHLGVVRGQQLRLLQLFLDKGVGHYVLRAWDLAQPSSSSPRPRWVLAQFDILRWELHGTRSLFPMSLFPLTHHPGEADVVYLR
ncbi:putative F-box/kelch-repeat protein At4g22430 [Humulus lupulus]|uniref:putative F-box/kelch-repeat protein At4g22430 n=1 Tax=Humulus lupulus TaxID=3486 RepID=UPI002B4078C9|nr:putative F-box/kelch-repeat protein At4g22430 [Humulus lupulus]